MSELLLYFAARAQNFAEVVVPNWDAGKIVVCDRWTDSTLAYQGGGRGLDRDAIRRLDQVVCHGEQPDRTIYLDVDLPTALNRARLRNPRLRDRMEEQSADFHARVRAAYLEIAAANPDRIVVINGEGHPEAVSDRIWAALAPALPPTR
jgi:dTMP kinase